MQKPVNLSEVETYPRCRVGDDALVPKNVALARMNVTQSLHSADLETTSQRGSTSRPHIVRPSPTPVGFMIEGPSALGRQMRCVDHGSTLARLGGHL